MANDVRVSTRSAGEPSGGRLANVYRAVAVRVRQASTLIRTGEVAEGLAVFDRFEGSIRQATRWAVAHAAWDERAAAVCRELATDGHLVLFDRLGDTAAAELLDAAAATCPSTDQAVAGWFRYWLGQRCAANDPDRAAAAYRAAGAGQSVALASLARAGLAALHAGNGHLDLARAEFERALADARSGQVPLAEAAISLQYARAVVGADQPAAVDLRVSLAVARFAAEGMGTADIALPARLLSLWRQADYPTAVEVCDLVLAGARARGDARSEARALSGLATLEWVRGRVRAAIELQHTALEMARGVGDWGLERDLLAELAPMLHAGGERERAVAVLERVLAATGRAADRAPVLNNLAAAASESGTWERAVGYAEQAVAASRSSGDREDLATALCSLGHALVNLRRPAEAVTPLGEADAIADEFGLTELGVRVAKHAGMAAAALESWQEAEGWLRKAISLAERVGGHPLRANLLCNLGHVFMGRNQDAEAVTYLGEALTTARMAGDRSTEAVAAWNLAGAYLRLGRAAEGVAFAERAVELMTELGDRRAELVGRLLDALLAEADRADDP